MRWFTVRSMNDRSSGLLPTTIVFAVAIVAMTANAQAPTPGLSASQQDPVDRLLVLKKFLQAHVQQISPTLDETTKFSYAFVDLNGDGRDEVIVHVTGRSWCGTGGCLTYIITPDGSSYRFVGRIPATRTPIRVLDKRSHGWHSVSVVVRVDAFREYEGELRFNGQKYPLGEEPSAEGLSGKVVIAQPAEIPLFP